MIGGLLFRYWEGGVRSDVGPPTDPKTAGYPNIHAKWARAEERQHKREAEQRPAPVEVVEDAIPVPLPACPVTVYGEARVRPPTARLRAAPQTAPAAAHAHPAVAQARAALVEIPSTLAESAAMQPVRYRPTAVLERSEQFDRAAAQRLRNEQAIRAALYLLDQDE